MTVTLTITCAGEDNVGEATHRPTVVAALGLDPVIGVVMLPTAQQRGNPQATRPHPLANGDLRCGICGDAVRVGKRLQGDMLKFHGAGVTGVSLQTLRRVAH